MNAIVIEHVPVAELPEAWRNQLAVVEGTRVRRYASSPKRWKPQQSELRRLKKLTRPLVSGETETTLSMCPPTCARFENRATNTTARAIELLQGLRNTVELAALKKMLVQRHTTVLPITEAITQRANDLLETLALSHDCKWETV